MKNIEKKWERFTTKPKKYFGDFQFYSKQAVYNFYSLFQEYSINKKINLLKVKHENHINYYINKLLELYKQYPKALNIKLELAKSYELLLDTKEAIKYFDHYLEQNPYNLKFFIHYLDYIPNMKNHTRLKQHLVKQLVLKKKDFDYINKVGMKISKYIDIHVILEDVIPLLNISNKYINVVLAILYSAALKIDSSQYYWKKVDSSKFMHLKTNILDAYKIKHIESLFGIKHKNFFNPEGKEILLIVEKNTDIVFLLKQHIKAKKVIVVFMSNGAYKVLRKPDEILKEFPNVQFASDLIDFNFESFDEHMRCASLAKKYAKKYVKAIFNNLSKYSIPKYIKLCEEHIVLDIEDRFYNFLFPIIGLKNIMKKYKYNEIVIAFDVMSFSFANVIFKEMQTNKKINVWFNVTTSSLEALENHKLYLMKSLSNPILLKKKNYTDQIKNLFSDISCTLYEEYKNMKNYLHLFVHFKNSENNYLYLPVGVALFKKFNLKMDVLLSQSSWINKRHIKKSIYSVYFSNKERNTFCSELHLPTYSRYNKEIKKYQQELNQLSFEVFKSVKIDKNFEETELFLILKNTADNYIYKVFPYVIKFITDTNKLYDFNPPKLLFTTIERSFLSRIAVSLARHHGIKTFGHHPGLISDFPRYKKPLVDYHFVLGQEEKRIFYEHFKYDKSKLIIAGSTLIDEKRELYIRADVDKYKKILNLVNVDKTILFITQHGQGKQQFTIIDLILKSIVSLKKVGLVIKPHPLEPSFNSMKYKEMIEKYALQSKCKVVNDNITYELMRVSDLVITLFSAVGVEAAIFGKSVLVVNLKKESYPIELDKLGIALGVHRAENIYSSIYDILYVEKTQKSLRAKQNEYFGSRLGEQKFVDIVEKYIEKLL